MAGEELSAGLAEDLQSFSAFGADFMGTS